MALPKNNVKTTYSDLKLQPNGALLASSDPIHVTAESMTAHNSPSIATYKGNARLWQDANMVEAPTIQFQKDQRIIVADSNAQQKETTALTSTDKNGKSTPVHVTSDHLTYHDSERKAHYEGDVVARGTDMTVTSKQMDVFFTRNNRVCGAAASLFRCQFIYGHGRDAHRCAHVRSNSREIGENHRVRISRGYPADPARHRRQAHLYFCRRQVFPDRRIA